MKTKTYPRYDAELAQSMRERTHADMLHHMGNLQRRNDLLQSKLDEAQAKIAKLMRETFK